MRDMIRQKLDVIDQLYPPSRLARSRERWQRLWAGLPVLDRLPFVFAPLTLDYYAAARHPAGRLDVILDEIILRGRLEDDFIPAFFPGCRQATIPNLFGAGEIATGTDHACTRLSGGIAGGGCLPEPAIVPGTIAHEWLAMQQYVLEETEGRLPVHVTDMQGPHDVCGQLYGYEDFLACAYEDEPLFRALLDRVTEAFILFWEAQQRVAGDCFVGTHLFGWDWVPSDAGASCSADSLVMVSPDFYRAFYEPYLARIADRLGGLSVHSCGDFSAVVPALCATPGVRAVNAGQLAPAQLAIAGATGRTLLIAIIPIADVPQTVQLIRERALRVDLTVSHAIPSRPGTTPADWSDAEWRLLARQNAGLIELLSQA